MTRDELLAVAKPILFNTEMVQAILNGIKTVTRRCVKPKSKNAYGFFVTHRVSDGAFTGVYDYDEEGNIFDNPQTQPAYVGDILFVKETWSEHYTAYSEDLVYCYKADGVDLKSECLPGENNRWWQSTYMPKEAARIFLRVTDVRVERLQDIITGDYNTTCNIVTEGLHAPCQHCTYANLECEELVREQMCKLVNCFIDLWNSTVKKSDLDSYGWDANPWVWVIEFERVEGVG